MSITFHCEYCNKEIKAADDAGGKWGKCPSCHNKLYVPNLNIDGDIKLAPVDEEEEKRKKQLLWESFQLGQDILKQKDIPEEGQPVTGSSWGVSDKGLESNIIECLRAMADGDLDRASQFSTLISPFGKEAIDILDRIAVSQIPEPELEDISSQVLAGLIRNLRSKID